LVRGGSKQPLSHPKLSVETKTIVEISQLIAILDYGMGNVRSIQNMLRRVGASSLITSDEAQIERADALILPGVGAFDEGMRRIDNLGLRTLLDRVALDKRMPILGICLGMQLLTRSSEEGSLPGLGWIDATTRRFQQDEMRAFKVPHMGWNYVTAQRAHQLFHGIESPRYYFVHSYHVHCEDGSNVLATTNYGYEFTSAVVKDNIIGTQFHPEKSHRFGMALLKNFARSVQHVSCPSDTMPACEERRAG
jgi:glutamine amidotransferase